MTQGNAVLFILVALLILATIYFLYAFQHQESFFVQENNTSSFRVPQEVSKFQACVQNNDLEPCAPLIKIYFNFDICQLGFVGNSEKLLAQCLDIKSQPRP